MALPAPSPWLLQPTAPQPVAPSLPAPTALGPQPAAPAAAPAPVAQAPALVAAKPAAAKLPAPTTGNPAAAGTMAGLSAASQIAPGTDPTSAAVSAGTSALAAGGAAFVASGFNPIVGLAVGGGAGLSSLVNSYLSTKAERKRDRGRKKILAEAQKKQEQRDILAREDALAERGFNREQTAMQTAWTKNQANMQRILETVNANQALKDRYVSMGRV